MWLRYQRLAIGTNKALVLHDINQVPSMIASFPLAFADQSTHSRRFAALVRASEYLFVGPVAGFRAIGAYLAIYCIHDGIFAHHAGGHTRPAAVRMHAPSILAGAGLMCVG